MTKQMRQAQKMKPAVNPYQPVSSGPGKGYRIHGPGGWVSAAQNMELAEAKREAKVLWDSDREQDAMTKTKRAEKYARPPEGRGTRVEDYHAMAAKMTDEWYAKRAEEEERAAA